MPVTTKEITSTERDALVLISADILGALVRHELQQHSDNKDTKYRQQLCSSSFFISWLNSRVKQACVIYSVIGRHRLSSPPFL